MELTACRKTDRKKMKRLYLTAFPAEERAPFCLVTHRARRGKAELLCAYDDAVFVGFVYMVCNETLAYIFYLAVADDKRGKGYGGQILDAIKKRYAGKRIFLAREQMDPSAPNYAQRVSRRNFYLRSGFEDLPLYIKEASVVYDVMGIGGCISPQEYEELITPWAGKCMKRIVDMRLLEK